jgi:hypothetical protein
MANIVATYLQLMPGKTEGSAVDRTKRKKKHKPKQFDRWPVTYRWAAMGTLIAYSAIGATKVAGQAFPADA